MRSLTVLLLALLVATAWSAPADHVIVVSVDGLRADLLRNLLANDLMGNYANFQRLVDEGVSTFNARSDYSYTVTLPNHVTMATGRPVEKPAGQPVTVHHGYISNSTPDSGDTLHNQGNPALPYVASVFDVAHDNGLTTALYASKDKFIIFDQSYDAVSGAPDMTGPDNGRDKIDTYHYAEGGSPSNAAPLQAEFMADLNDGPPDFSMICYRDPDSAGHTFGWGSTGWNTSVQAVDGYIGEILDFVDANPGVMGRTVVVVTADHGGTGTGHSTATDWRNYTIPFFAWGDDVPVGGDLYELNSVSRMDPGGGRPDYNAPVAPIRNGDCPNLALSLLELPPVAGSTINAAQDLVVTSDPAGVPQSMGLAMVELTASPNPFNPRTELSFEMPSATSAHLGIYDLSGRLVRVLVDGQRMERGLQTVVWNGADSSGRQAPSGVYFYRLTSDAGVGQGKIALVK